MCVCVCVSVSLYECVSLSTDTARPTVDGTLSHNVQASPRPVVQHNEAFVDMETVKNALPRTTLLLQSNNRRPRVG